MFTNAQFQSFRNLKNSEIEFSEGLNFFIGENGQGKSNIVEALTLLASGDSFRDFENESLIKSGDQVALLKGSFKLKSSTNTFYDELEFRITNSSRSHYLNQKKVSSSKLRGRFKVVVFSPDSLEVIKHGSETRRKLLDQIAESFDPKNSELLAAYKKALAQRNKLLKFLQESPTDRSFADTLDSLNPQFLNLATDLTCKRLELMQLLLPYFNQYFGKFVGSQSAIAEISFKYTMSGVNLIPSSHKEIHNSMQKRIGELRSAEIASGVSLVGPHRHDIEILSHGKDSRYFSSQGQQRSLIIALKLAQIMYHKEFFGYFPILILDDVLSELDETKRANLVRFLNETRSQVFVTATDLNLPREFDLRPARSYLVAQGSIAQQRME